MELARRLVEDQKMPICIINGAVGGTRIDQHQRNPADPEDVTSNLRPAALACPRAPSWTHGIRGILWHQGENDQGADGPTGGFGCETYRQYFLDMAAGWKQDYPNIQHYYLFQIWPKIVLHGHQRIGQPPAEVQRTLPDAFTTPASCPPWESPRRHVPLPAGRLRRIRPADLPPCPAQTYYGVVSHFDHRPEFETDLFASEKKDQIVMEFDQPVKWDDALWDSFIWMGKPGRSPPVRRRGIE